MANYFADTLKVKSVYVLDDSGAYGVGLADAFQAQAKKRGINVLGRDQLNPKEADYTTTLTKIKALNPRGALLRRRGSGRGQGRQEVLRHHPERHQRRRRRRLRRRDPEGRRLPGGAGMVRDDRRAEHARKPDAAPMIERFVKKYGAAARQLLDHRLRRGARHSRRDQAGRRLGQGRDPRRGPRRDPAAHVKTLQGEVSFDANGDVENGSISVFQIRQERQTSRPTTCAASTTTSAWRRRLVRRSITRGRLRHVQA